MGDKPEGAGEPQVTYLQLNDAEKASMVAAVAEQTKSFLVSGFRDEITKKVRADLEKETDPRTRPTFGGDGKGGELIEGAETKRFGRVQTGADGKVEGGWLTPIQSDLAEGTYQRKALAGDFAKHVDGLIKSDAKEQRAGISFNILKFPLGDIDNYSPFRV